jgi:arginase family enzyme
MSRNDNSSEKVRFIRALAFEIHRKRPAEEALADCIEREGKGGRHRLWRPASVALEADGFVAALRAAELLGDEAAAMLRPVVAGGDHRLLAATLNALADYLDTAD